MNLTKAVTHIPLRAVNPSKLARLNALAAAYMALCQVYVTHFCTVAAPDKYADYVYPSGLSARWQRVAVMQAAGVAQSWRTRRRRACERYLAYCAFYEGLPHEERDRYTPPMWKEWALPTLWQTSIQANANVVAQLEPAAVSLEAAEGGTFDLWLKVATLEKGQPLLLPVQLAAYHKARLAGPTVNRSLTLARRRDGSWWLTLSVEETVKALVPLDGETAVDVGQINFLTDDSGRHYGTFRGDLDKRHRADRLKRQCKAKLRACLEKKGVERLPSTTSASSQRLARHVTQSINRAVNEFFDDHPRELVVMEALSVSAMRFKARAMNARLYASQLGHLPRQVAWGAAKRGLPFVRVNPAYSSQECQRCQFVIRTNRPNQQTFCCQVCGFTAHADHNASRNLLSRAHDEALARCRGREEVKHLLLARHAVWQQQHGYP